jgi:3D (Asp-Asp-Asp) domain-containing protein
MKRKILNAAMGLLIGGMGVIAPVTKVGADLKPLTLSQPKPLPTLTMRITAYASVPDETSDHPFITASGEHVRDGIVATNILPFGTEIKIPALFGDKVFVVEDRMNKRFQNTIDIWMKTKAEAIYFGVAHTSVVILNDPSFVPPKVSPTE